MGGARICDGCDEKTACKTYSRQELRSSFEVGGKKIKESWKHHDFAKLENRHGFTRKTRFCIDCREKYRLD